MSQNYDGEFECRNHYYSRRMPTVLSGETMTKQEFTDECNVNNILKKYEKTGLIDHLNRYQGQYGDVALAVDYQEALNTVMEAEEMFMSLPSSIRNRFDNDPAAFLAFTENPANEAELIEMGLAHPRRAAETASQPVKAMGDGGEPSPVAPEEGATPA